MKKRRTLFLIVFAVVVLWAPLTSAADWMPDPNLRRVISEKLRVETLTIVDMQHLYVLFTDGQGIKNLKGLEHAINLDHLAIFHEAVSDLTPLAGLQNLKVLQLNFNPIVDISPLSSLTQLVSLELKNNQITYFTPLLRLTNLQFLDIRGNPDSGAGQFVSADPAIINALKTWMCHFERPTYVKPVKEKIENREYPSIAVGATGFFQNTSGLETRKHLARSDLFIAFNPFHSAEHGGFFVEKSPLGGFVRSSVGDFHIQDMKQIHEGILHENPNTLFLAEIRYFDGYQFGFAADSPYWLRHPDGTIVRVVFHVDAQGNESWESLVDYTHPDVIEMIVAQAVAVANCGLYDGIVLDNWHETSGGLLGIVPLEVDIQARVKILQGIRQAVPEDFLIAVNPTWRKIPRTAEYINGALMETWASEGHTGSEWGGERYTRQDYLNYEEAVRWYDANLREPRFISLPCRLPSYTDRQSPHIRKTVRTFTTLSLTHSDGYVNVGQHNYGDIYYNFFDAPLGRPIGGDETKGVLYETPQGVSIEGLFIREFTGGYAVYNRSGKERRIKLPEKVDGWASGETNKRWHTLGDLDGEIYLKTVAMREDVNGDGVVNILDLVIVANAFGRDRPDLNADGVVNILDLVLISTVLE